MKKEIFNVLESVNNLQSFMRDPLSFTSDRRQKHGDAFSIYLGPKKFHFISHPDLAEKILINNAASYRKSRIIFNKIIPITGEQGIVQLEGSEWQRLRKQTGPLFSREAFNAYPDIISHYLDQAVAELDEYAAKNSRVDIAKLFVSYAIKTGTRIFVGISHDDLAEKIAVDFMELNYLCGLRMRRLIALPLSIPTPINRKISTVQKRIKKHLREILKSSATIHDQSLLGLLKKFHHVDDRLSFDLMCDQLMTFLFAGFETTAASLTFCFYLLAQNEEVAQTARNEFSSHDEQPLSLDAIKNFQFANAVYREALRMYPPAWILAREAIHNDTVADISIKKRDNVIICIREIHRHNLFWQNEDRFLPARFLRTDDDHSAWREKKCAFIPFGAGARICSGSQLAMLEAVNAIARLLKRYHFSTEPTYQLDLEAMVTLCPRGPVFLRVSKLCENYHPTI